MIVSLETRNPRGRDLIVGDVHGCVEALMEGLAKLKFNPSLDRVFCLGDLIDRGPHSLQALRLLKEPWFYSLRGNHEDMLLSAFHKESPDKKALDLFFLNGGNWVLNLNDEELKELSTLLPLVEKLPYIRTFVSSDPGPEPRVLFHLAHAELKDPEGYSEDPYEVDGAFLDDDTILEWGLQGGCPPLGYNSQRLKSMVTWGRGVFKDFKWNASDPQPAYPSESVGLAMSEVIVSETPFARNLSLTLVGHSIVSSPTLHCSHLFLDGGAFTGADRGGKLFIADAAELYAWACSSLSY